MKYFITTLLAFSLLITACSRRGISDFLLRKEVIGSWSCTNGIGATIIAPDGSWCSSPTNFLAGTWQVSSGILIFATMKDDFNTNHSQVGQVDRCKIILVDLHHLTYQVNGIAIVKLDRR